MITALKVSILEIILMVGMGIGVLIWAIILVVKFIKRKRKPQKNETDEIYENPESEL